MKCVICARNEPADGWTCCRRCLDRLDDNLARIAELVAFASSWLLPRTGAGNGGRTVPGSRPPLDIASLDAAMANDVLPLLESWERMIREDASLSPYGVATAHETATVARSVGFLRSWLLWAAETADFPVDLLANEVKALRYGGELPTGDFAGLEQIDPDYERDHRSKLKCPGDHPDNDGRRCHARIYFDREHPTEDITCLRCHSVWTGTRLFLLALGDETQRIWRTPAEIVELVDVSKRTIQRWAEADLLERNGSRYDLGQVWRMRARVSA